MAMHVNVHGLCCTMDIYTEQRNYWTRILNMNPRMYIKMKEQINGSCSKSNPRGKLDQNTK